MPGSKHCLLFVKNCLDYRFYTNKYFFTKVFFFLLLLLLLQISCLCVCFYAPGIWHQTWLSIAESWKSLFPLWFCLKTKTTVTHALSGLAVALALPSLRALPTLSHPGSQTHPLQAPKSSFSSFPLKRPSFETDSHCAVQVGLELSSYLRLQVLPHPALDTHPERIFSYGNTLG